MEYEVYGTIASLGIAVIAHAVKVTWTLSRMEKEIRQDFDAHIDNLSRDIQKMERDSVARADNVKYEVGETGAAIRQKIHDVETWTRDTFVRKDNFEAAMNRLEKSMERLGDRFEKKLDDVFEKIEKQH